MAIDIPIEKIPVIRDFIKGKCKNPTHQSDYEHNLSVAGGNTTNYSKGKLELIGYNPDNNQIGIKLTYNEDCTLTEHGVFGTQTK